MDKFDATQEDTKEFDEEFEDAWQCLTSDLYHNMREDMRGMYEQGRNQMKLNHTLRMRLLQQTKEAKQTLTATKK